MHYVALLLLLCVPNSRPKITFTHLIETFPILFGPDIYITFTLHCMQSAACNRAEKPWKMVDPSCDRNENNLFYYNRRRRLAVYVGFVFITAYILAHVVDVAKSFLILFIIFLWHACACACAMQWAWKGKEFEGNVKSTNNLAFHSFTSHLGFLPISNVSNWAIPFARKWLSVAVPIDRCCLWITSIQPIMLSVNEDALRFSHMIRGTVNIQLFRSSSVKPFSINLCSNLMSIPIAASAKRKKKCRLYFPCTHWMMKDEQTSHLLRIIEN